MNRIRSLGAIALLVTSLLTTSAIAQTINFGSPGVATGIDDLTVDGVTYDVTFEGVSPAQAYGSPPTYTFTTESDATAAVTAIVDLFNANGTVILVGQSDAEAVNFFRIAWKDISTPTVRIAMTMEADDVGTQGNWQIAADPEGNFWEASTMFAVFTATGSSGPGNQSPTADSGGDYSGTVGVAVVFDGSGSSDPDGSIVDYRWDFGDGSLDTGVMVSHTYASADLFQCSLTVTDDGLAQSTSVCEVRIDQPQQDPVADPGGPYEGQVGQAILFDGSNSSDADGNVVAWDWDFGDGNMGTGETVSHTYADADVYTVTLTVTDNDSNTGQTTTQAASVSGNQAPTADAGGPYVGFFVGDTVTFDGSASSDPDGDGTIVDYRWDFGDGRLDTGAVVSHVYSAEDEYVVTLTVTDDGVKSDSETTTVSIAAQGEPPVADDGGPYVGTAGLPVVFDGTGSTDSDDDIVSYDWDFGDGNIGSGDVVEHTYATNDTYDVVLTVTDSLSQTDTDDTTAEIDNAGTQDIPPKADPGGPYSGLVGQSVEFDGSASSDPDSPITAYDWNFGDGNTGSGMVVSHTYATADQYDVELTVTSADTSATTVFVTNASSRGDLGGLAGADNTCTAAATAAGLSGTWTAWLSDSGTNASDRIADSEYRLLDGTIVANDLADLTDGSLDNPINIDEWGNSVPNGNMWTGTQADGTASADHCSNWTDATNSSSATQGDTDLVTVGWTELGSASPCDFQRRLYCFADTAGMAGPGATDSTTTTATIADGNAAPVADAGGPYSGTAGAAVDMDGSGSTDDGTITDYSWDFGDNNTASDTVPTTSNTYTDPGPYVVSLTVTDDDGVPSSDNTLALIGIPDQDPVSNPGGPYQGIVGRSVDFDGSGSDDVDGDIVSWDWDFGDGNTGTGQTVSYAYATSDTYTVMLTVTDDDGLTSTSETSASILAPSANFPPIAGFDTALISAANLPTRFDATDSEDRDGLIVSYDWDFGDGNTGRGIAPFHTYTVEDDYNVTLTVTDNEGKTGSDTEVVKIRGSADLRASISVNTPAPYPVDGSIEWLVTISNDGPADEPSAEALIVLPITLTLESADASQGVCVDLVDAISCELGALANGADATITVITVAPPPVDTLSLGAFVNGRTVDPDDANSSVFASVTTVPIVGVDVKTKKGVGSTGVLALLVIAAAALARLARRRQGVLLSAGLVCCLMLALPATGQAQESGTWYAGLGFGGTEADYDSAAFVPGMAAEGHIVTNFTFDDSDSGWKLFGGFNILEYFAAEIAYVDLGEAGVSFDVATGDLEEALRDAGELSPVLGDGFSVTAIGRIPFADGNASVFAKAGGYFWRSEVDVNAGGATGEFDVDSSDFVYGIGGEWFFSGMGDGNFGIRLEWEVYALDPNDVDMYSGSLMWRF